MFISSFIFIFNFNSDLNYNFVEHSYINQDHEPNDDTELELSQSSLSEYSGVGKAQNVTEYGEGYFLNNDINVTNSENATVIIPNDWEGNAIFCNVTNIYEYGAIVMNQTFDNGIDQNRWSNRTTGNSSKFTVGHYNNPTGSNDSIYLKLEEDGGNWQDTSSLINYSFPLLRENIPYEDWYIKYSVKWIMTDNSWRDDLPGGSKYVMGLEFSYKDGSSTLREFNLKRPADIENNTWYPITMLDLISPFPDLYGYDPPANVSIYFSFGVKDAVYSPVGSLMIYYDNISFEIQSIPKPSAIDLNITDNASGGLKNQPIQDFSNLFGKGQIFLEGSWSGEVGGTTHEFSFSSNSTGNVLINTDFFVRASSLGYTTTNIGSIGSEFIVENGTKTIWTMYVPISIPGSYSTNYYLNVSKPLNWNVTQVIDPYSNNRINEVIGARLGNSTLTIPNNIITGGVWKIVAEAPNYIELANLFRKDGSMWSENNTFHIDDKLKINASLIPTIDNTKATLKIFSPNGSLWYQEGNVSVDINGNVEFSEITLGTSNASTGEYSAQIIWHNNDINMSQVGFSLLQFKVLHSTNLTTIDSYFENYVGDPLLLKVKYIDSDFNESIPFGSITYNSTYGVSGIMTYQGSGIYIVDLDTSSLKLGNYYFSFNATKEYYEDIYVKDLIHLKIVAQPLELEVPHEILNTMANSYFICQINVTGLFTGALIWPVNISTDWLNPYTVINHDNGSYTLSFSTYNLPTQGISEIYIIVISATKTNYGATSHDMTIKVNPIPTIINVNSSLIYTPINEIVEIELSYNQEGSGVLINEAMCSVTWSGSYIVISQAQGFIVSLNTSTLSIDTYTAILKLEKAGYETAYKSITIIVEQKNIEVNTIGFHDSIQGFTGENIKIKFNLTEVGSRICIENASVFYSWEFGTGFFDYVGNGTYELNLKLPENIKGNHKMTLTISKEGTIYKTQDFSFIIIVSVRQVPNILIWILIAGVLILIGVLSVIGLRSKVILPKKRAKESKLLARTQKYKDIMNIEAVLVSQRESGLPLFLRSYYALEKYKKELLSGFIHAITTISKEIVRKEELPQGYSEFREPKSIESLIELDFKHFYFLIGDYKELRVIFILKEKASDRFKNQLQNLLLALDLKFSEDLANWTGNIAKFEKFMPSTIDEYFELYYKELFQLNKSKYIAKVREETELSTMENRALNVIYSISKGKSKFYLQDIVEMVEEKNKDLVIESLESLLEKKIILSSI